jgi:hypothetical protein
MVRVMGVVVLSVLASSCGYNRVALRPVPEKSAPVAERVRAFKELAPESGLATSYYQNGAYQGTLINSIMLGDGTRVEDPRDLLPAVDPASPTANYVDSFEEHLTAARSWSIVGWSVFGAGVVAMLVPLMLPSTMRDLRSSNLLIGLGIGGGVELLSLIPIFVGSAQGARAQADRVSAFQSFPRALQKRLALDDDSAPVKEDRPPSQAHSGDAPLRVALSR